MSSFGISQIEIERRRQEEIERELERQRRENLKLETKKILRNIEEMETDLVDKGNINYVLEEYNKITRFKSKVNESINSNVDKAYEDANNIKASILSLNVVAEARKKNVAMKLEQQRVDILAEIEKTENLIYQIKTKTIQWKLKDIAKNLKLLLSDFDNGFTSEINKKLLMFKDDRNKLKEENKSFEFREATRRHIILSLKKTMEDMGFIVSTPKFISETNQVVISGVMPSGKTVLFRVSLDGNLMFDLDGYQGRECAKDLDKVLDTLVERFEMQCSPPQYNWKNPDRISKGSKGFPSGGKTQSAGGRTR